MWKQGGIGEQRAGERLQKCLAGTGVKLLHDRRVPGHGSANIDHIAVGPGGITIIDTKTHHGKVRTDWYGGLFVERRTILKINGRDQTRLITGVEKQMGYMMKSLGTVKVNAPIELKGALCFPNVDGLPLWSRLWVRGVLVDGPRRVAQLAARPGELDPESVERLWMALGRAFPPAVARRIADDAPASPR